MGRQFRVLRRSGGQTLHVPMSSTLASSVAVVIPNYGVTDITDAPAGDFQLDAPDVGVRKTLICSASAAAARVVRFSSAGTVSGGTLATTAGTQITFNATVDQVVVLLGRNSTHWVIESMYPPTAVNATGIVLAGT